MAGSNSTNALRGDSTNMGYENSSCTAPSPDPYGVALDLPSYVESKICAEITPNFSVTEIDLRTVGCGGQGGFGTEARRGTTEYAFSLSMDAGFQNGFDRILAQYFGAASGPFEQTVGEGDFLHILTLSPNANGHFGTLAYETAQGSVMEAISTFTESFTISMAAAQDKLEFSAELVANDIECASASVVNSNADLQSLSFTDKEIIVAECNSSFRIKELLDDGTDTQLQFADQFNITSFEFTSELPLETIPEITQGACNAPTVADSRVGTVTIEMRSHEGNDVLSYEDWKAGKSFQAAFTVEGKQINAGVNKTFRIRFPKLVLVDPPVYNITEAGFNGYTLVFQVKDSENILFGFSTTSVEIDFINQRAATYLEV